MAQIRNLLVLIFAVLAAQTFAQNKLFGAGFVPRMEGGDEVEKRIHRSVGEMPEIDQMFNINDTDHFLETLVKLKRQGKKLDFMVMAGHGSHATPYIGWAKADMLPEELDIKLRQQKAADLKRRLATPGMTASRKSILEAELKGHQKAIQCLEEIPGLMNPNAVVLLVNCSTAGSDEGKKFVRDMGVLLLGADGGQIIASTGDVELLEVEDLWDQAAHYFKNGGLKAWGDSFISANWAVSEVKKGSNKAKATVVAKTNTPKKPEAKAPAASYTGVWESSFGKLTLTQTGTAVNGSSDYYSTTVDGTIESDGKMRFKWSDSNGKNGVGTFELSSDGQSFSGSWNYILSDGKTLGLGGSWGGQRIK